MTTLKNEELLFPRGSRLNTFTAALRDACQEQGAVMTAMRNGRSCLVAFSQEAGEPPVFHTTDQSRYWKANGESITSSDFDLVAFETKNALPVPAPANLVQPRLLGWRTESYLEETAVREVALMWEVHHTILPIFEGDPNTKLVTPLY